MIATAHDWWWDMTYPQSIVLAALFVAVALVILGVIWSHNQDEDRRR